MKESHCLDIIAKIIGVFNAVSKITKEENPIETLNGNYTAHGIEQYFIYKPDGLKYRLTIEPIRA